MAVSRRSEFLSRVAFLLVCAACVASPPVQAAECDSTSVGFTPLIDLLSGTYMGFEGGLYPGGVNTPPPAHLNAGLAEAAMVQPLGASGAPDAIEGSIVLLSIGMCNTSKQFTPFMSLANGFAGKNPRVRLLQGAQGGWTAPEIADSTAQFWSNIDNRLEQAGLTREQVQVIWFLEAVAGPTAPFPAHADSLVSSFRTTMNVIRSFYPNARLAYFSSRIYAGYASSPLNPEPWAYESGFAVKWLIEEQINGSSALNHDPGQGPVNSPWLAWGPYTWADGTIPRSDGLQWFCPEDFANDGTHPSEIGSHKTGSMLFDFFTTDATTIPWFLSPATGIDLPPSPATGVTVHPAQPNPFRATTAIALDLAAPGPIRVDVVTVSGRRIKTLVDRTLTAGRWTFEWNGTDSGDFPVGLGVYFLQVRSGEDVVGSMKTTLIR